MRERGYIDLDFTGVFVAIFVVGAAFGGALFIGLPWLWRLVKPLLHALTAWSPAGHVLELPVTLFRAFFRLFFFRHFLGQRFRWYRRWYGGRWERHWIEICGSDIWLDMSPDSALQWPAGRPPCSRGTPEIEDYPTAGAAA